MDEYAITTIVWTCVGLFVITGAITLLALLGVVQLGGNASAHNYYLKTLFKTLVVQIAAISVGAFAVYIDGQGKVRVEDSRTILESHDTRIRLLERAVLKDAN